MRYAVIFALCLSSLATPSVAQQPAGSPAAPAAPLDEGSTRRAPSIDPAALDRGRELFGATCGFCHGRDARGTGAGPDMTTSSVVLNDEDGKGLAEFLQVGRPQKGMPSFPSLSPQQVSDIAAFLHTAVAETHNRTFKKGASILIGDAMAGQRYFNGAGGCGTCHSPEKDLKGVASRLDDATLQDRIVNPSARGSGTSPSPVETPKTVNVTLASGKIFSGTLVFISDFYVTLTDASGVRHSFTRDNEIPKVKVSDPLQAHIDLMTKLDDKDMHDLTAYLAILK